MDGRTRGPCDYSPIHPRHEEEEKFEEETKVRMEEKTCTRHTRGKGGERRDRTQKRTRREVFSRDKVGKGKWKRDNHRRKESGKERIDHAKERRLTIKLPSCAICMLLHKLRVEVPQLRLCGTYTCAALSSLVFLCPSCLVPFHFVVDFLSSRAPCPFAKYLFSSSPFPSPLLKHVSSSTPHFSPCTSLSTPPSNRRVSFLQLVSLLHPSCSATVT